MKAFVTGGTGFIGQWLIRELLAHGYTISALVRTFERAQQLPRGVRAIPADIAKPHSFQQALRGHDVVFHLAGIVQVGVKPKDYSRVQRINVEGTHNVLALAAEAGVPRMVYASSVVVYGNTGGAVVDETYRPISPLFESHYQRTKHAAHYDVAVPLQQRGAPLVIAVPGAAYGPGDLSPMHTILRRHARGRLPVMIGPDASRAWTYVEDVAVGLRLCAESGHSGETYNLAGPAHTFRGFFAACAAASGSPAPLVCVPSAWARTGARALTRPLPALAERLRVLAGVTYLASAGKAANELGWQARPLAEGLRATFADMQD